VALIAPVMHPCPELGRGITPSLRPVEETADSAAGMGSAILYETNWWRLATN